MDRSRILKIMGIDIFVILFFCIFTIREIGKVDCSVRTKLYFGVIYLLVFIALFIVSYLLIMDKKIRYDRLYLKMFLLWGIIFGMALPAFTGPDEWIHYYGSYGTSNIMLHVEKFEGAQATVVRQEDFVSYEEHLDFLFLTMDAYEEIANGDFFSVEEESNKTLIDTWGGSKDHYKYVIPAIGISLARIFGFGKYGVIFLGRFFNLLFFAIVGYFCIKIIPYGKFQVTMLAFFPLLVEICSSYSYDTLSNAVYLLFVSYCLYLAYTKLKIKIYDLVFLLLLWAFLVLCKKFYFPVILLVLLFPKSKLTFVGGLIKHKWIKNIIIAAFSLVVLLVCWKIVISVKTIFLTNGNFGGTPFEDASTYSILDYINHPITLTKVILKSINNQFHGVIRGLLGYNYGQGNVYQPTWQPYLLLGCIVFGLVKCQGEKASKKMKVIYWIVLGMTTISIILGALFLWTSNTEEMIWGIQPRYFLPVAILFMIVYSSEQRDIYLEDSYQRRVLFAQNILMIICVQGIFWRTVGW